MEKHLLFLKNGAKAGGRFVFEHQTKETVAEILLAWAGKGIQLTNAGNPYS